MTAILDTRFHQHTVLQHLVDYWVQCCCLHYLHHHPHPLSFFYFLAVALLNQCLKNADASGGPGDAFLSQTFFCCFLLTEAYEHFSLSIGLLYVILDPFSAAICTGEKHLIFLIIIEIAWLHREMVYVHHFWLNSWHVLHH